MRIKNRSNTLLHTPTQMPRNKIGTCVCEDESDTITVQDVGNT